MKEKVCLVWLVCLMGLSGCRLADPALQEETEPDRLIGMYITQEYLDLFDHERYLNDPINQIRRGEGLVVDAAGSREYEGRIYAEYRETDGQEGEYVFEGIDGIRFFCPFLQGAEDYRMQTDPEVTDVHIKVTDSGREIAGTIYCPTDENAFFFGNPVYQTAGGEIYLLAGTGISGNLTDQASFSQRLDENRTTNRDGKETQESMSVSITICGQDSYERYVIAQMDEADQKIGETVYHAEDMPDTVTVSEAAAYLLCTGYQPGSGGREKVSRQVVELSEEESSFSLFVPGEKGLPVPKWIVVER